MARNKNKRQSCRTLERVRVPLVASSDGFPGPIKGKPSCPSSSADVTKGLKIDSVVLEGDSPPSFSCPTGSDDTTSGESDVEVDIEPTMESLKSVVGKSAHQVLVKSTKANSGPVMCPDSVLKNPARTLPEMVTDSCKIEEGFQLSKVEFDDQVFVLDPSQLVDVKKAWGHCLIGFFAGSFPGYDAFHKLCNSWNVKYQYFKHNSGWIVFQFECEVDRDAVFAGGPYFDHMYCRHLVMKSVPRCFQIDEAQDFSMVPVWIKLPGFPLDMRSKSILSQLVSRVGTPIRTDSITTFRERFTFARVLVEVDASKELVRSIQMKLINGRTRKQRVEYEFIPKFCSGCKKFGHRLVGCDAHKAVLLSKANSANSVG